MEIFISNTVLPLQTSLSYLLIIPDSCSSTNRCVTPVCVRQAIQSSVSRPPTKDRFEGCISTTGEGFPIPQFARISSGNNHLQPCLITVRGGCCSHGTPVQRQTMRKDRYPDCFEKKCSAMDRIKTRRTNIGFS
jgi:hypothetical protein